MARFSSGINLEVNVWNKSRELAATLFKGAETTAKLIASITAIIAALAFFWPWFGSEINMITARRFGVRGYAFYEVAPDPKKASNPRDKSIISYPFALTHDGNFYAPRAHTRFYEGIGWGDLFQAGSAAYLHDQPTAKSAVIYRFRDGECALVIGRIKPEPAQEGYSGGWFDVVTASCGLFK